MLSDEDKYFVWANINPNNSNCLPILDTGDLMIIYTKGAANNMVCIRLGRQNKSSISATEPSMYPPIGSGKGYGSSVSEKLLHQNRFIKLESDDPLVYSVQSDFYGSVDGISYGGKEWSNVNNIIKLSNTYHCIPRTQVKI